MFCSLNCHGVNNSVEYIRSFLSNNHCDFLCLQELWLIDSDLHKLNNIHTDYTYVATMWQLLEWTPVHIFYLGDRLEG